MGSVRMGPPSELVSFLKYKYPIQCFFETGSFRGDTAAWAADRFEMVVTVEHSRAFHQYVVGRFADRPSVMPIFGNSPEVMADLMPKLPKTLFWLDAHWCGEATAGKEYQCPLLDEIAVVAPHLDQHFVMIDDARLFLHPPLPPEDPSHFPTLCQVTDALRTHHEPYILVFEDVIMAFPADTRAMITALFRNEPVD